LQAIIDAFRCILEDDISGLLTDLYLISDSVCNMKLAVKRMHGKLENGQLKVQSIHPKFESSNSYLNFLRVGVI
jgi:hypothetical protein